MPKRNDLPAALHKLKQSDMVNDVLQLRMFLNQIGFEPFVVADDPDFLASPGKNFFERTKNVPFKSFNAVSIRTSGPVQWLTFGVMTNLIEMELVTAENINIWGILFEKVKFSLPCWFVI